ncbi:hypothetical protein SLEP1_g3215 [Rubroshorea leprosula]|uniref:Uncharacterized protein n=1 Tax=Rubroshorea leprosula TaxID=152421 RepID=A0AAV5HVH3_9ROSI|nr:hypothetical protein SLEP1_g3215 [Rubroshorea leprosula]
MRSSTITRDHIRYYDFHQDHAHMTEESNNLKSKLEDLTPIGTLSEYIQKADQPRFIRVQGPQPQGSHNANNKEGVGYQQAPPPLPFPAKIIHLIMDGLEVGGLSSKQRKLYVREVKHQSRAQKRNFDDVKWKNQPITFISADFEGVVTPHNDPLVTSIMINNCEVQHVLVDTVSMHKLSTNPLKKPVAQNRRLFGGERLKVIKEEVEKLLRASFKTGVDYCEWVANLVLLKKGNGKWRMCINYTDLN